MVDWRPPLSARHGDDSLDPGPFEGVPDHMRDSLWAWTRPFLIGPRDRGSPPNVLEAVQGYERAIRRELRKGAVDLEIQIQGDAELWLDLVDHLLSLGSAGDDARRRRSQLETILRESGSVWVALADRLERRVGAELREAYDDASGVGDNAAQRLEQAWTAAFGRSPNPESAYDLSIKTIETALIPVVSPQNSKATLGTLIADISAKPTKWEFVERKDGQSSVGVVLAMIEAVWLCQHGRHGEPPPKVVRIPTPEEAEFAVTVAVMVVRWVRRGLFKRAP